MYTAQIQQSYLFKPWEWLRDTGREQLPLVYIYPMRVNLACVDDTNSRTLDNSEVQHEKRQLPSYYRSRCKPSSPPRHQCGTATGPSSLLVFLLSGISHFFQGPVHYYSFSLFKICYMSWRIRFPCLQRSKLCQHWNVLFQQAISGCNRN